MDQETMNWIAQSTDALAQQIRTAFQPLVDAFTRLTAEWSRETPDHRHIMRRKIRRMVRP
jgi:hypothetical protein